MRGLVPNRLMFRFEFPLHYREKLPRIDGRLRDWSDADLLPALGELDGEKVFAPVLCCWNEEGIAVATRVRGRRSPLVCNPKTFWKGDNMRVMVDTRDARSNKRATRYCHQFYLMPTGGKDNAPIAASAPINRAKENSPLIAPDQIRIAAEVSVTHYSLEAILPAEGLNGFDPQQHQRIGFYYILEDRDLGQQSLSIGDDLPWHVDPSLWATAVLKR